MAFYFPSATMTKKEAESIAKTKLVFNKQGYLMDPNLEIQKSLEDSIGQPIMIVQETTQNTICILLDPYGIIQNNPVSHKRTAMLKGDFTYLKSTIDMMIRMHPQVQPQVIISAYSFQCSPEDRFALKQYTKDMYHCI